MKNQLDLYLRLERIMMELDDQDNALADRVRDLMDPLWYALSDEDRQFLDSRREMEIRTLYPVNLNVPDLYQAPFVGQYTEIQIPTENGIGKSFPLNEAISWAA
jgi:hypothetical protein